MIKKLMAEKSIIFFLLFLGSLVYFSFGLYHLTKFETVDEHFWKYERVPQYWYEGILGKNPKKTYINDKPGVTTAVISGAGLLFQSHPENHRVRSEKLTDNNNYTLYDTNLTERINFSLRFPLLLFNGVFVFYIFWIIRKITNNIWIATFSFLGITTSPVLIGISQIINPDTLLWSFSSAALFSYFALLKTREKKYIILTTLFTGLSLLSKYTSNILFPLFLLTMYSNHIFGVKSIEKEVGSKKYFLIELRNFAIISLGSAAVYSFFMPAVFIKIKYLYEATIGFSGLKMILIPILTFIFLILLDAIFFKAKNLLKISLLFNKYSRFIIKITYLVLFLIFSFVIINGIFDQKFIPFDNLREQAYTNEVLDFGGLLANENAAVRIIKELLIQFYPFIFSLPPIILLFLIFGWAKAVIKNRSKYALYVFIVTIFSLIYFLGSLVSGVLTNIRYSIMLYPLFSFLFAISIIEFAELFSNLKEKKFLYFGISILFIGTSIYSLNGIKPFYFNYANSLLPKQYSITDSWGYGAYEAAQYLNSLPNAENLVVWADRNGICQFIKGKCLTKYKIDLSKNIPDYFIISKRGSMRHPFIWDNPALAKKPSVDYYYDMDKKYEWALYVDNRSDNFVKIIKSEER